MGCPMSKRVQTSSDTNMSPVQTTQTPTAPDENSNGVLRAPQTRRPLSNYDNCNNGVKHLQNIPGQINNHLLNPVILKNRPSTRTQSQVEFFAMLDSKIEAGADLGENGSVTSLDKENENKLKENDNAICDLQKNES